MTTLIAWEVEPEPEPKPTKWVLQHEGGNFYDGDSGTTRYLSRAKIYTSHAEALTVAAERRAIYPGNRYTVVPHPHTSVP